MYGVEFADVSASRDISKMQKLNPARNFASATGKARRAVKPPRFPLHRHLAETEPPAVAEERNRRRSNASPLNPIAWTRSEQELLVKRVMEQLVGGKRGSLSIPDALLFQKYQVVEVPRDAGNKVDKGDDSDRVYADLNQRLLDLTSTRDVHGFSDQVWADDALESRAVQEEEALTVARRMVALDCDLSPVEHGHLQALAKQVPYKLDYEQVRWDAIAEHFPLRKPADCRWMFRWLVAPPASSINTGVLARTRSGKTVERTLLEMSYGRRKRWSLFQPEYYDRDEDITQSEQLLAKDLRGLIADEGRATRKHANIPPLYDAKKLLPAELLANRLESEKVEWSLEEEYRLLRAHAIHSDPCSLSRRNSSGSPTKSGHVFSVDWKAISQSVATRSLVQCRKKWIAMSQGGNMQ